MITLFRKWAKGNRKKTEKKLPAHLLEKKLTDAKLNNRIISCWGGLHLRPKMMSFGRLYKNGGIPSFPRVPCFIFEDHFFMHAQSLFLTVFTDEVKLYFYHNFIFISFQTHNSNDKRYLLKYFSFVFIKKYLCKLIKMKIQKNVRTKLSTKFLNCGHSYGMIIRHLQLKN